MVVVVEVDFNFPLFLKKKKKKKKRYLFERMKAIDVYEKVDVIVLSDHGMTDTPLNQVVRMQDYDLNFGSIFQVILF